MSKIVGYDKCIELNLLTSSQAARTDLNGMYKGVYFRRKKNKLDNSNNW